MKKYYLAIVTAFVSVTLFAQMPLRTDNPNLTLLGQTPASTVGKALRADASTEMITEQPEGTLYKNMYRASVSYYVNSSSSLSLSTPDGILNDMVVAADGSVYIKDPFGAFVSNTWLKGDKGQGDTIEVKLPQPIYKQSDGTYYAWRMVITEADGGNTYTADLDNQVMKFVWRNDSLIKVGDELLGLGDANGRWGGYGDVEIVMNVVKDTLAMPQNPNATMSYKLHYTDAESESCERIVEVAMEAPKIFVKGFYIRKPEAWIQGTLTEDGKAVFGARQYLGVDEYNESHAYFFPVGAKRIATTSGTKDSLYFVDSFVLQPDAATGNFTTDGRFVVNEGIHKVNARAYYKDITFELYSDIAATPKAPTSVEFYPYDEQRKNGSLMFDLDKTGTNGETLNQDKLFYNIYFGDELYTFSPDKYSKLTEPMTDVPYTYADNSDFYVFGNTHMVYFFVGGFNKIGVQALYKGGNETRVSDIVWKEDPTGINSILNKANNIVEIVYTDLSGRKVAVPTKGIYVKTVKYVDGRTKTFKTVIRK